MWSNNADSILATMVENLPPAEDLAKAAAVAGAVGLGAATVATQVGLDAQTPGEVIVDAVVNTVVEHSADVVVDTVSPTIDSTRRQPQRLRLLKIQNRSISLSRPAWT